jgi:hypothetical protein
MLRSTRIFAAAVFLAGVPAGAMQSPTSTPPLQTGAAAAPTEKLVCKHVVSAEPGSKPRPMCMTKAQWTAKKLADAKDPNRIVCRYETNSRSKFASFKVCMSFVEWQNQRQLEREHVERIQSNVCVKGGGC